MPRNPKPDSIKKLQGTFRKRREKKPPASDLVISAEPPEYFSEQEKTEFRFLTTELIKMGVLQTIDMNLIIAYCMEAGSYFRNMEHIKKVGSTFMTPDGSIKNRPEVMQAKHNLNSMIILTGKLGLSPVDRIKLTARDKKAEDDDPLAGIL
jgi:P27 family predicted phage terminase small subunit